MTDLKDQLDQLDLAALVVEKTAEIVDLHGKENALQGGLGLDEKTLNELAAIDAKFASEYPDEKSAPRDKLVEHYKAMYRIMGMDENFAETIADLVLNTNVLSAVTVCLTK